ncbi:MFS transporter (plasmid) [Streptomyces albus subsp. chlorinus]|uniref:MFS transporter n=1 Tax=Streptomyces albus TaxID=1888 RepID=UPI003D0C3AF2
MSKPRGLPHLGLRLSAAKQFMPLTAVIVATLAGAVAEFVLMLTMPWYVYATTGSAFLSGLALTAQLAPPAAARLLAGPAVVDRLGLRLTAALAAAIQLSCIIVVAVLVAVDGLAIPVLLALLALVGAAGGVGTLAKDLLAPVGARYVGVAEGRGISLSAVVLTAGQLFSPSLGAFLAPFALTGLVVVAALFAVNALVAGLALPRGMEPEPVRAASGYWKSQGEGFKYFFGNGLLVRLHLTLAFVEFLVAPMNGVFLPVWAKETGAGPGALQALASAAAVGGVVGSLVAVYVVERVRPSVVLSVACGLIVPQLLALALTAPFPVMVAAWAVCGFAGALILAETGKLSYGLPAEEFRSRAKAISGASIRAGSALGGSVWGAVVGASGLTVLIAPAVLFTLVAQGTVFRKDFRAITPQVDEAPKERAEVKEPTG